MATKSLVHAARLVARCNGTTSQSRIVSASRRFLVVRQKTNQSWNTNFSIPSHFGRRFSSSSLTTDSDPPDDSQEAPSSRAHSHELNTLERTIMKGEEEFPYHHRVWTTGNESQIWTKRFIDRQDEEAVLKQIEDREFGGNKMKAQQLGVLSEDPATDMELLTRNYSATSLASALRDREEALQQAAVLSADGKIDELKKFLKIFHPRFVMDRRLRRRSHELLERLGDHELEWIRKCLMRMPRNVVSAHAKRAGVVLALCTVEGVPCVMLEKRSPHLRSHPDEVSTALLTVSNQGPVNF
eukprot:scaffold8374_cov175-Amphora_coffeaeformis.AAC.28